MNRTKITILSIGGVSLALALALGYLVWSAWDEKRANQEDLESLREDFDNLTRMPVFPCSEGVKAITDNRGLYVDWIDGARTFASVGDRSFPATTPAAFKAQMTEDAHRIASCRGTIDGTVVKSDFNFGYGELIGGSALPTEADLPRLQREWYDLVRILDLMVDSGVSAISSIEVGKGSTAQAEPASKEVKGAKGKKPKKPAAGKPKNAAAATPSGPSGDMLVSRFEITFLASASSLVKTLNALTSDARFIVVESAEFARERDELAEKLAGKKAQEVRRPGSRLKDRQKNPEEESLKGKVVTDPQGQGDLKVKLVVSVYDFRTAEKTAATSEAPTEEVK